MLKVGRFFIRDLGSSNRAKSFMIAEVKSSQSLKKLNAHLNENGFFAIIPDSKAVAKHTRVEPQTPFSLVETDNIEKLISEIQTFSQK